MCLLQAAFPERRCLGPLAQSCFLTLNTIVLESILCNDLLTVRLPCQTGLHEGRDLKCPQLNSCSTPNPQTTVFPVSVKVTSLLPASQARYQGVSLHSSLSPPTVPSISKVQGLCLQNASEDLTISPPATARRPWARPPLSPTRAVAGASPRGSPRPFFPHSQMGLMATTPLNVGVSPYVTSSVNTCRMNAQRFRPRKVTSPLCAWHVARALYG